MKKLIFIIFLFPFVAKSQNIIADTTYTVKYDSVGVAIDTIKVVRLYNASTTSLVPKQDTATLIPSRAQLDSAKANIYAAINNRVTLQRAADSLAVHWAAIMGKQAALGFTPVANTVTVNGHALSGNVSVTASDVGLGNVSNNAQLTIANNLSDLNNASTARTNLGVNTTANIAASTNKNFVTDAQATVIGNTSGTNTGDNATNTQYSGDYRAANFVAGTNYQVPITGGDVTTSGATSTIGATKVTNAMLAGSIDLTTKVTGVLPAANGGTGVNNSTRTLTINTNAGTVAFPGSSTTQTFPASTATIVGRVASAQITATASATSTTTLFTPAADGYYRLTAYLKITTTGTSPVAGPITITYTDGLGSVAQSHVMMLANTSGAVVTTTVNNSTTTGTVTGTMTFYAKASVAIQYAIAVSGTFGAGRYQAFLTLEAL